MAPSQHQGLTPTQVNYAQTAQWKQVMRALSEEIRTSIPAFLVEDIDPVSQTVTVQIGIQERVRTQLGSAWYDIPPIIKVPIVVPRGGGYSVTIPLLKGDEGMLVFCDACFDNWWVNGQNNAPKADNVQTASGSQTQLEVRRHHVHDCGFLPGMWSQQNVLQNYSTDSLQVRSDDGTAVIDVSTTRGITLSSSAVKAAFGDGTAQTLVTNDWLVWFTTYVLPHITLPPTTPPPPLTSVTSIFEAE